jgi:hypothetical protein
MNWDALGALAELAGAVAVVASLIYVGRQMSFNAHSVAAAAHENAVQAVRTAAALVASDPSRARLFSQGTNDPSSLRDDERIQFFYIVYSQLKAYEGIHYHYLRGTLDEGLFDGYRTTITIDMTTAGFEFYWSARKRLFSADFVHFIDSLPPIMPMPSLEVGPESPPQG